MIERIQDIQSILRLFLSRAIQPGDSVLDATTGRGRDTLFLAECVGEQGKVYGLDIQPEAIETTRILLASKGLMDRVELHVLDHAQLDRLVPSGLRAVMFNLGYLPDGDHQIVTEAASTILALKAAVGRLEKDGLLSITVYRGHPGATGEAAAVQEWIRTLPSHYAVLEGHYPNLPERTPYWYLIQEKGTGDA